MIYSFKKTHYEDLLNATAADFFNTIELLKKTELTVPHEIKEILFSNKLTTYSSVKYFLVKHLYDYFYISQLNESENEFDVEIFDFWNKSNFSDFFSELLKANTISSASIKSTPLLYKKILYLFQFNVLDDRKDISREQYSSIYEFGDQDSIANLPEVGVRYSFESRTSSSFKSMDFLQFLPSENKFEGELESNQISRIQKALSTISSISPELFELLKTFTQFIVPSSDEAIVSHSTDELPGFSTINLVNRDDIDLLDDLIHENGHHYLNHYLNHTHLLDEDEDKIYYSPWREEPRAIRGIFHAYFTFYWAFFLFKNLLKPHSTYKDSIKVHFRFVEEYLMLAYSYSDLLSAYDDDKITEEALLLVNNVNDQLINSKEAINNSINYLSEKNPTYFDKIVELETTLKNKREELKLS